MADRSVVYRLVADVKGFQAGLAQASASTKKLAGDLTGMDKAAIKQRESLTKVGNVAGGIGLVAAAGLGAAVMKAADFDQSMSKVQAATHETTANMDRLREAALDAGAKTAFSATEAAEGIEALSKAGVSTDEVLSGGLMGALDLAAAGEMEVGDAAEAAAGAMAQFKLSGEDVPHIADLLAAGAGKAQGEVSDMVMALKQGGTVAAQTGLSIEETTGTLAAMAEQSLLGSDAGTSFKTMLSSLTPNSDKAAAAMEEYNIHAFDAQGNFVGMTELAGQLRSGLSDLTAEQRATALETIFGSDAVRAASIVYDNGAQGIRKWIDNVDDAGFAAETAAIKQDNLRGDLEKLGGSLETALIGTGEGSLGPLRKLVQGLEGVVNAYNDLPGPAKTAVSAIMGGAAVIGGSIWVGTKLINGISSTRDAMSNLGWSGDKATRSMKGVAKAGAALAVLEVGIIAVDGLTKAFEESLPGTEELTGRLLDLSSGGIGNLGGEFDSLGDSIGRLTDENRLEHAGDSLIGLLSLGQVEGRRVGEAKNEIEALDSALANLATSTDADTAAKALDDLADSQGLSASELSRLKTLLPQYDEAVAGAANQSKVAALETDKLAGSSRKAAGAMGALKKMSAEEAKALEEAHKKAVETGQAFFGLGDKVDKAKVSLGGWIRSLEKQAQALREFTHNTQQAAKKGLDEGLIASLEEAGPAGALRMKQLADASQSQIARANRAWRGGEDAIDDHADAITNAQRRAAQGVHTRVEVDGVDAAIGALSSIRTGLDNLDGKTATTWVTTRHVNVGGMGPQGNAEGGTILGQRYPYGDKVLSYLAPGEEVISNRYGQADQFRADRSAGRIPAYSDGGTARRSVSTGAARTLTGLRIEGRLDVATGNLRGVIRDEIDAAELMNAELERAW